MDNNNFCGQPWIGIHAWPDGSVFPCCMYDSSMPLGNINKEDIQDLVNNENYTKLRQQLLNNEKPLGCQRCYKLEESGITTLRQSTSHTFKKYLTPIIENKQETMSDVRYLDIRFSNICNFKCRTCGPELSSKWGPEIPLLKNEPDPGIIQIPREKFWQYYEQALETAEEIVFAGGEALMQEEHYAALNKLVELERFNVKLLYTTNLSTLKYKQIDLFELWSKFKKVEIYASLDASYERAEYLRKGTVWKNIVENRKKLKLLPGVQFYITPTISLFNVWHFPDFYKEWVLEDLLDPTHIRLNILTQPPRQQANVLENKEIIIDKWKDLISWIVQHMKNKEASDRLIGQFESVINFLATEPDQKFKLTEKFGYVNQSVDNIRNEDLYEVFPELRDHLKIPSMRSKTFCVFPFFNLNSNTDGSVKLCCSVRDNSHIKKSNGSDFNLGKDSLEEIWNNEHMQNARWKMLIGEEVADCKDCYRHEKLSGSSSRTESNKKYQTDENIIRSVNDFLISSNVPLNRLNSLELRLGNTCNLSCNSCWGGSSSKVNEERQRILSKETDNKKYQVMWASENNISSAINKWFKNEVYIENLKKVSGNLKRIYLTGGEPTLIKENRVLLKDLIDSNNTDCFVSFTTNGTTAENELLDLMSHFPNNEIQISLDGVRDEGHYIRYPLDWDEFDTNFNLISSLPNIKIVVYTVISAYNLYSLPEIWHYLDQKAELRPVGWYPIFLDNPNFMRTSIWSKEMRKEAVSKMQEAVLTLRNLRRYVGDEVFQKIYEYYNSDELQLEKIPEFLEFNNLLDKHRGTNFSTTFFDISCRI